MSAERESHSPAAPDRTGEVARALSVLGLCGASVALAVGHALTLRAGKFLRGNDLPHVVRQRLVMCILIGGIAAAAASAAWLLRRRDVDRLTRFARLCAPLLLTGLIPVALVLDSWTDALVTGLACSAIVLALEPTLRGSFEVAPPISLRIPDRVQKYAPIVIVATGAVFYALYMSHYTVLHHRRFNTMSYDLGQFDNEFYNALHGHPFRDTALIREGNGSSLRGHASFAIYALLPFYALKPGAETLLRLQAILLGAAAIPIYGIASRRIGRGLGALVAVTYLLYPPMHGANFYDFHFQTVAASITAFAIDALDRNRRWLFGGLFALALACREDVAVSWAVFGVFMILAGWRPRMGAIVTLVSTVYFGVVKFLVMPHFGSWWFSDLYKGLYPAGDNGYTGIIKTILTNPGYVFRTWVNAQKLSYFLQIFVPIAFLPLRRRLLVLLCVPGAFFTLLTTDYAPTTTIGFQYSAYWIPWIFLGAALALEQMERIPRRAAAMTLAVAMVLATYHWGAIPPHKGFRSGFFEVSFDPPDATMMRKEHDLQELVAMVPKEGKLAVSERELPHVSTRLDCYALRDGIEGADWILYATDMGQLGSAPGVQARNKGGFRLVAERPNLVLLKRVEDREP